MITPARSTDPATSHAAAKRLNLPRLEAKVLHAIRQHGNDGATADEICLYSGLDWRTCTPRIRPLIRKGLIVDTGLTRAGASGRQQRVVRAV